MTFIPVFKAEFQHYYSSL